MRVARGGNLDELLGHYSAAPYSYDEVGATAGELPPGYRHTRRATRLGSGRGDFEEASALLFGWEMHRRAGLTVAASGAATAGRTVVLGVGLGLVLVVPCRVVYVVNEPHRHGFGYGTLPDHPEQGEESFVVVRDDAGAVWLHITAFSRPGSPLARLAGPVNRAAHALATRRYELALRPSRAPG